uniref:Lysosomal dipeptide transporter MFSD1 n=1 Tax=Helicotheca tamesis TaxID=374047 RepID=A0A7S2MU93_9STRA
MPASLHRQLKEVMPRDGFETKFQLQFTLTSVPGIVLPLFAGAFVDRFGGRLCLLVLSVVSLIGQIVASVGVQIKGWPLLLAGRFIYGLAFQPLFAAEQAFLTSWFEEKQLGLALGLSCTASYVGQFLSFIVSPKLSNEKGAAFSYWVSAMVMAVSVLSSVAIFHIDMMHAPDIRGRNQLRCSRVVAIDQSFQNEDVERNNDNLSGELDHNSVRRRHTVRRQVLELLQKTTPSYWLLCCLCILAYSISGGFLVVASGFMLERNLFKSPPKHCVLQHPSQCSSGYLAPEGGNSIYDLAGGTCHLSSDYAPVIPHLLNITKSKLSWQESQYVFEDLTASDIDCTDTFWEEACTSNYCSRRDAATIRAGFYMSIPLLVTVATSALFGYFMVDKMGWHAQLITVASILRIIEHTLFAITDSRLILPLILDGFAYSMAASSLWPAVPLTIKGEEAGSAFGLMTCIQSIGDTVFPVIISLIYTLSGELYKAVVVYFIACSLIYFWLSIMLIYTDKKNGSALLTGSNDESNSRQPQRCCVGGIYCFH